MQTRVTGLRPFGAKRETEYYSQIIGRPFLVLLQHAPKDLYAKAWYPDGGTFERKDPGGRLIIIWGMPSKGTAELGSRPLSSSRLVTGWVVFCPHMIPAALPGTIDHRLKSTKRGAKWACPLYETMIPGTYGRGRKLTKVTWKSREIKRLSWAEILGYQEKQPLQMFSEDFLTHSFCVSPCSDLQTFFANNKWLRHPCV